MNKIQEKRGITLIALIITIIVLLILAGITIGALTSNNSVLKQGREAKNETNYESELEKVKIAVMAVASQNATTYMGNITKAELDAELKKQFGNENGTSGQNPWAYIGEFGVYGIKDNGEVTGFKKKSDDIKVSFVDNNIFLYEEGWTWEDFCNSEYNVDNYVCSVWYNPLGNPVDGVVGFGWGLKYSSDDAYGNVLRTDVINPNYSYSAPMW